MNKKAFTIVVMIAVVVIGVFVVLNRATQDEGIINVGVILPLTGGGAIYGQAMLRGIELAHFESGISDKIRLIVEDDAGDARTGINAFNSLISRNVDIVIGGPMSHVAASMIPIANRERILLVSPMASKPDLSTESDFFFRVCATDDVEGKILANYISNVLGLRRVAFLYPNVDYGVGIMRAFLAESEGTPIEIVFNEGYQIGTVDFRTQILRIRNQNPDILISPAYLQEGLIIFQQLNELNCNFYVAGVNSYFEDSMIEAAGRLRDRVFFTYSMFSTDTENERTNQFIESFRRKFNETPNSFAAHGFDSFYVIEHEIKLLLESRRKINSDSIREGFTQGRTYNGVTGQFYFDESGNVEKDLRIIWMRDINR